METAGRLTSRAARASSLLVVLVLAACADNGVPGSSQDPAEADARYTPCEEPRPEQCTQRYLPVCAARDTGIRCVTTPCDASEWVTYGNACTACSDRDVYGYTTGRCEDAAERTAKPTHE